MHSWRLTLAHKGDGFVAQAVERIEGRSAGGVWIEPDESRPRRMTTRPTVGRFIELHDEKGRTIYRRAVSESVPDTLEYPTGNADRPFGRVPVPEGKLVFVRVPGHGQAKSAVIVEATVPKDRKAGEPGQDAGSDIVRRVLVEVELPVQTPDDGGAR